MHPSLNQAGGQVFGRYRLLEPIGSGGMAVVYRALTLDGERSVVIKRVLPALCRDPSFARMLLAEARLSCRLRHPAIVEVYEMGRVADEYYIAMEHVDGVDLVRLLNRCLKAGKPLPVGLACWLVREMAQALAYAHDLTDDLGRPLGIVHRDVTPSNIMLTTDGRAKLLDFGVAKAAEHVVDDRTRTGTLKGKVHYLSPEQADGLPVDRRADVFSLGIVLHECLAMKRLFVGDGDLATLRLIRQAEVTPPSAKRPEVPPELDAIVLKMLSREASARYQSATELAEALTPFVERFGAGSDAMRDFIASLGPIDRSMSARAQIELEVTPHHTDEDLELEIVRGAHSPWHWRPEIWKRLPTRFQSARVFWGSVGGALALLLALVIVGTAALVRSSPHETVRVVSVPTPASKPTANEGTLLVTADVGAARFELDGSVIADQARSAKMSVPAGSHTLVVTAPRRKPLKRTFIVTAGATVELPLRLEHQRTAPGKKNENYLVDPFRK